METIETRVLVNMNFQVSLQDHVDSQTYKPKGAIAALHGSFIFSFGGINLS